MENAVPNFLDIFGYTLQFIAKGGWIIFVMGMVYMLYKMYRGEIEHQFVHSQEWVFLNIKVAKENMVSTLGVESIYAQMHALFSGLTFAQIYIEGRVQLWYCLELISLGGKISFVIRAPKNMRNVVEAAFYAHYPDAEITQVDDYMANFNYDPDEDSGFEIWGTEWKLAEDYAVPLKTYRDFEHPTSEQKIVDPLAGVFEALAKIEPHEFYGIQITLQPINDEAWKPHGEQVVKEMIGEEVPHETKFSDLLLAPFSLLANFKFTDLLFGGGHGGHGSEPENKPRNNWMTMTEAQKERVGLVERKISKPGYKIKIRHLYIAPKDKFDPTKKAIVVGAFRPTGSVMTNRLKPDTNHTWTGLEYSFSPTLEKPFLDLELKKRKRYIFKGYKNRDIHIGSPMFILNIEELATLYHFPITTELKPMMAAVEQTLSKKSQPPSNLPVAE